MLYHTEPENFVKKFEVTSLFLEHQGKILLLHRQDHKPQGDTWGVPAGKIEEGEDPVRAILRELKEETSISLSDTQLEYLTSLFVRYPGYDFVYHMYFHSLTGIDAPGITLDPSSHKAYVWVTPQEALMMNLIEDLDGCIKLKYKNVV